MKVTILSAPQSVTRDGKNGEYTKHTQEATLETANLRMTTDLDIESTSKAFAVGVYNCDVEAQLRPGKYGLELPRFLKLTPAKG